MISNFDRFSKKEGGLDQKISHKKYLLHVSIGLTLIFTLARFSDACSQITGVVEGDRVRISAPSIEEGEIKGTVSLLTSDMIMISMKDRSISIPNEAIRGLDISTGKKRNTGKGAIIGGISGGILLGIVLVATNEPCKEGEWCFFEMSDGEAFGFGAFAGALGGGLNGAIIGSLIKTDRWKEVPVGIAMRSVPSVNSHLTMEPVISIRFSF